MLENIDKKIIAAMQDEIPLVARPYEELAKKVGISEDELVERLNSYQSTGKLRKMGTVLRHRAVGFAANALCAWVVDNENFDEVARIMIQEKAVTHCYSRVIKPNWPYNFYTMIHARTKEKCQEIAQRLSELAGIDKYVMLYSTKEWKKSGMHYFPEFREP